MKKIDRVKRLMAKKLKAKVIAKELGLSLSSTYNYMSLVRKDLKDNPPVSKLPPKRGRPRKVVAVKAMDLLFAQKLVKAVAKDNVNHPEHYKTGGIETIDFIEAKNLGYHLGNVVKYITRADHKGNRKEDLLKAQWYLNRAISNLK